MGAFYLTRKTTGPEDGRDVRDRFVREGFGAPEIVETESRRLYLFRKIGAPGTNLLRAPDGGFCALTGTILYRGRTGEAALPLLLADDAAGGIDWHEAFGQYALLIGRDDEIRLVADPLGIYPVWHDDDYDAVSSSFLAVAGAAGRLSADPQCVYEYVFQGATYGDRTLFREVHLLAARTELSLGAGVAARTVHAPIRRAVREAPIEEHLEICLANLHRYYDSIASAFGDGVDTALSGGYDSRLTLALCRAHGIRPSVHVYGSAGDQDVRIAHAIGAAEGFAIEHVDKSGAKTVPPDAFAEIVERNLHAFQGHPADGVFENGTDLATRLQRCAGGRVALNGGGGEVFRNFFYLPDRSFTVRELLWTFYGAFDPEWCTGAFDENVYLSNLGKKVKRVLDVEGDRLTRVDIEALYALFRCRYWMGKNNSVNNRLGPALTPFIDANVVPDAVSVPLRYKNSGRFEGRMIARVSPALAAHMSDYGHSFAGDPPLARRLRDRLTYARPPRLRRLTFRIKNRKPVEKPYWLSPDHVGRVVDPALPFMRQFFRIDRVNSLDQLNRILTLELLFTRLQPETPRTA
jgi:hypothetical protein